MILVDSPIYWHRQRRWSHMVSDASLDELHAFAAELGMPPRAFQDRPDRDHPHYDLPEELWDLAIELGARHVSGRELIMRMYRKGS